MKLNFIKKIITSKTFQKVLCIMVILFVGYIVFSVGSTCFADDGAITAQTKMENFNSIAKEIIKITYVLLWPLLFVCGIALDNSLVYGSWLHLDAPLRSLWNVMKNIANFALGFLVLFAILRNMVMGISGSGDKKWSPFEVIKNTLIAGVLIQMSWFLVAAVIDISTIVTYAVGGLPITVLKSNVQYSNRPIMSMHINASSNSDHNGLDYNIYYSYGDHKIAPCLVKDDLSVSGTYIVGPDDPYVWDNVADDGFYVDRGYCAVGGWPYKYEHVTVDEGGIYPDVSMITMTGQAKNKDYNNLLVIPSNGSGGNGEEEEVSLDDALSSCQIIPVDESKLSQECTGYGPLSFAGDDPFFQGQDGNQGFLYSIDNLIEQSKGYVGPLITIYSSLLDIQSFANFSPGDSYVQEFISLIFKLIFSFVLIAPLAGLAVILIVRIGILWIVIASAPVLILIWVFFHDFLKGKKFFQAFDIGNIIKLIFAPVIITLAISLSLVFINAISGMNTDRTQRDEVFSSLGIKQVEDRTYSILGLVDIQLDTTIINKGLDDIAYFITLLFATGIIRFFLVTALKMCGDTGKKVGNFIGKNVGSFLMSAPIVPLPGGRGSVSISSLKGAPALLVEKYKDQLQNVSNKNMEYNFPWLYGTSEGTLAQGIVNDIRKDGNITSLNGAQIKRLAPIFGTSNSAELIQMARNMNEEDINALTSNYDSYNQESTQQRISEISNKMPSTHTSTDASDLSRDELNIAVQYDNNLKNRASGMVGYAVHTNDGVSIVDVIKGTESNPKYKIIDRAKYEKDHFGDELEKVDKQAFDDGLSSREPKYIEMEEYIKKLKKEYDLYKSLERKTPRSDGEEKLFNNLQKFFTSNLVDHLQKLGSYGF